jgi:kynurenine formamidase
MPVVDLSFPIRAHSRWKTNLDRIGAARCRFLALPLALEGADGSPVRAIAITE